MSIIGWLILGLIAGFVASKIVNIQGQGIVLGIAGALVGGFIFDAAGKVGVTGFNAWSLLVAIIGSVVVLVLYHAATGLGHSKRAPAVRATKQHRRRWLSRWAYLQREAIQCGSSGAGLFGS